MLLRFPFTAFYYHFMVAMLAAVMLGYMMESLIIGFIFAILGCAFVAGFWDQISNDETKHPHVEIDNKAQYFYPLACGFIANLAARVSFLLCCTACIVELEITHHLTPRQGLAIFVVLFGLFGFWQGLDYQKLAKAYVQE